MPDVQRLAALLSLVSISFVSSARSDEPSTSLLVKAGGLSAERWQQLAAQVGVSDSDSIPAIGVRIVSVPASQAARALETLQGDADIEFAEENKNVAPDFVADDPYFTGGYEWHLPIISAPQAWNVTGGSASIIIAVLDSGVDSTHPDLAANIVPGWNIYNNNSDTADVYGHGTAVAGIAAAVTGNGIGVASVAPLCRIMPVRISGLDGAASYSAMAQGLTYAADHGARVANISYMASDSSTVASAAQYFQNKGGIVTVSAGNYSTFDAAADNPYVLTVSATDANDALTSWSNTGNNVDLAAPGDSIATTTSGGGYAYGTGTSFSAPIVAAVGALVMSVNPGLSGAQVQDILKRNADDLGSAGWDPQFGYGRVNASKAVAAAGNVTVVSPPPPSTDTTAPVVTITSPSSGANVSKSLKVSVSATDGGSIAWIDLYIDGVVYSRSTSNPATFSVNTSKWTRGQHTLTAKAADSAGNIGVSAGVLVNK